MKFGFTMFPTRDAIPPGDFGVLLEDRGFESLFMPDHTHIPAVTREHHDVAGLAPEFRNGMDALVALGAITQATTTPQIGTAVLLVTERDPIITAKEVASVDVLSGGCMNFGVGPGWINQEMRNHGTDPDTRWAVMRERVEAMQQIWSRDIASYQGKFVGFDNITSWPKPVQRPPPDPGRRQGPQRRQTGRRLRRRMDPHAPARCARPHRRVQEDDPQTR